MPIQERWDLRSQAFKQNPFPTLAQLRAQGPITRVKVPYFGKVWIATTYTAVNELLRDHHRFIQNPWTAGNRWVPTIFRWLPRNLRPLSNQMLIRDEPDHRRLRSLVERAFQRQSVSALRPRLEALAEEALDRLAAAGASSTGGVDLVSEFARPFPLAVICELLGLPPDDRPKFTRWASGISTASTLLGMVWAFRGLGKLMDYLRQEIQRQAQHPRDGLLGALIEAEEAGDRLSEDELLAMVFLLLAAGHETTLHQFSGSVLTLLDHPQQLGELTNDWSLAETAVPELLRHYSFALVAKPRFARHDTEFYGQSISKGQVVFACLAAANVDPLAFPEPERLDLRRDPNRHLAFGTGIHVCLGAQLARVEIEIALERLFTGFPGLKLAVPRDRIRYSGRFGSRSLLSLPVTW